MKKLLSIFLIAFTFQIANAQNDVNFEELIKSKKFTFHATNAIPQNSQEISKVLSQIPGNVASGNISLDPNMYFVKFSENSIDSNLPYYGRSFSFDMNKDDNGIKFNSKDFSEKTKKNKKGNYQIDFQLKDVKASKNLSINMHPNGSATLTVNNINKESISYFGYIKPNN